MLFCMSILVHEIKFMFEKKNGEKSGFIKRNQFFIFHSNFEMINIFFCKSRYINIYGNNNT